MALNYFDFIDQDPEKHLNPVDVLSVDIVGNNKEFTLKQVSWVKIASVASVGRILSLRTPTDTLRKIFIEIWSGSDDGRQISRLLGFLERLRKKRKESDERKQIIKRLFQERLFQDITGDYYCYFYNGSQNVLLLDDLLDFFIENNYTLDDLEKFFLFTFSEWKKLIRPRINWWEMNMGLHWVLLLNKSTGIDEEE